MSRLEDLARKFWVDALIALLAIAGALELVIARNAASDPPPDLWLSVLLLAVVVRTDLRPQAVLRSAGLRATGCWPRRSRSTTDR